MSVLVVGGDYLGNIPMQLEKAGFTEVLHLSGRKRSHLQNEIPQKVDCVIVLTDFVNHSLATVIKEKCRCTGKKALFAKRAWSHIAKALEEK